ncbi:MAG: cytochrome c family protein [Robiginitomaculum sp.]|nr:cytochrome c family protein [Robiginitomaculum sp.]MDQ7078013.1 cytochrome c family protein [Robiginitomaculum sp.]
MLILLNLLLFTGLAACEPTSTGTKAEKKPETSKIHTDIEANAQGESAAEKHEETAAPDLVNGQRQFSKCKVCHTIIKGGRHKVGPNLYGILGKPAASSEGFRYSSALKKADIVWDKATLDKWIQSPRNTVPGTSMSFIGIRDEKSRRDLLAYILKETAASD